jgi:hypothetical protein
MVHGGKMCGAKTGSAVGQAHGHTAALLRLQEGLLLLLLTLAEQLLLV